MCPCIDIYKAMGTRHQNNLGFALGQITVESVQTNRVFSAVCEGLAFSFAADYRLIGFQRFLGGNSSHLIAFEGLFFFFLMFH